MERERFNIKSFSVPKFSGYATLETQISTYVIRFRPTFTFLFLCVWERVCALLVSCNHPMIGNSNINNWGWKSVLQYVMPFAKECKD